jgi:glycosyltransferase involved in cell wall biosynthesis
LERHGDRRLRWSCEETEGQVDAINRGLRRASGDVVGWLNSDDVLLPGALARVAAAFAAAPDLKWMYGRCDYINEDDRVIRQFVSRYKHRESLRYSHASLIAANFVSQQAAYWRRSLLDQVGYLDGKLQLAFDYDLWLRFAECGPPLYIADRMACFRWYESSKSGSGFRSQFIEDFAIAMRRTPRKRWLFRKLVTTSQILTTYEIMAWGRALRRCYISWAHQRPPAVTEGDLTTPACTGPQQ